MTDDELKALVASLAQDSKELREAQKKTDEQLRLTGEQMRHTDEQFKRTEEQMRHTDEQFKRTDRKLKEMGIHLGNISNNQGAVAEEFFFNSLIGNAHLGDIHFDDITKNMEKHRGQIQEEYDLVMTNGDAIGIIEVKYKVHENDLQKLERKMQHFKQLFPIYQSYKLYGAIAAFHIHNDAKQAALQRGFFVLQRKGKLVQTDRAESLLIL